MTASDLTKMTGSEDLSNVSELYNALSAPRRCHVIQFLKHSDEASVSVRTLARVIAANEEDVPRNRATGEPYRNAYNALSQTHLPTLSDAGIIIYDSDRQTVADGPTFELAALLFIINQAAYQTHYDDSLANLGDFDISSTTD